MSGTDDAAGWQDLYQIGVTDIDDQHRLLFTKFDEFCAALDAPPGRSAIAEVLYQLERYAEFHFVSEEALMERIGYTGIAEHKSQHQHYRDTLALLIRDFHAGIDILEGVYFFFNTWLRAHIQHADQKIGAFMASGGGIPASGEPLVMSAA